MQEILDFFSENDHFARHCGIELLEVKPSWAKARMEIQPFHINGAKTVHGGAIFTLADFTFAAAANSRNRLSMAIDTSISFFQPSHSGTLFAEAEELSANNRLGYYQVKITNDKQQLVAQFQGTAYRKQKPLLTNKQTDA
ncbi:MAG: PaaI family thioesterase [Desulfuromusa sp.]